MSKLPPPEPSPDPAQIDRYIRDAMPTTSDYKRDRIGTETRRVSAVNALLTLYRDHISGEWNRAKANPDYTERPPDRRIVGFFQREFWGVLRNPTADPGLALGDLFKGRFRRGRREPTDRNFDIAVAVEMQRAAGKSVEAACADVGEQYELSAEQVMGIYYASGKPEAERERWQRGVRLATASF